VNADENHIYLTIQLGAGELGLLELVEGDITEMETDAIVNAANARLILGGGDANTSVWKSVHSGGFI